MFIHILLDDTSTVLTDCVSTDVAFENDIATKVDSEGSIEIIV